MELIDRNTLPVIQYTLRVTGSTWTTLRAVGVIYRTLNNIWRIDLNIAGTFSSGGNTVLTIAGVTFANTIRQSLASTGDGYEGKRCYTAPGTSTIVLDFTTVTGGGQISGSVELASKPEFIE